MLGHKHDHERGWTPVAGIVADSQLQHHNWTYVVDYRRPEGDTFRVTVPALPDQNIELRIGTQVRVEVDARSGAARMAAGQVLDGGAAAREAMRLRAGLPAGLGAQGDRTAGREKIWHLKADLQARAGMVAPAEPVGFSSPEPSTFDRGAPPAAPAPTTFSSPDPSVGQPTPAFGQPGFSAGAPATTFSSPESAGSLSAGGLFVAFGVTRSGRIARLEDQRDRGQITPEQFAAQRQQIQDEI